MLKRGLALSISSKTTTNLTTQKRKPLFINDLQGLFSLLCGEEGIRTPETVSRLHAFQACALSHSATSPKFLQNYQNFIPDLFKKY